MAKTTTINHSNNELSLNEVDIAIITQLIGKYMTAYELTKRIYGTSTVEDTKKYLKRVKRRLERLVKYNILEKKIVEDNSKREVYMLKTSEYICINGILIEPFMINNIYGIKMIRCPFYHSCDTTTCKLLDVINTKQQ